MAISATDTQVRFLSGSLANLKNVPVTDGNIYVTTDERVMHVDIGGERLRLSDIVWLQTSNDLPKEPPATSAQAFYYLEKQNILVHYGVGPSGKAQWNQVNALPDLTSLINPASKFTYTSETNGASAKLNLYDYQTNSDATPNAKVTVTSGNTATTNVSSNSTGIVVKSADTTIASTLGVSHSSTSGNSTITLTETTGGYNADGTAKAASTTSTKVDIAGSGVTTSVSGSVLTINAAPTKIVPSFDSAGALKVAYTAADGLVVNSTAVTPTIRIGKNSTTEGTFVNGVARLAGVYTAAEVDAAITAQLKTANAMVFEGTVSPTVKLPVSAPRGATYMASANGTISTTDDVVIAKNGRIGDLFIASGEEKDGVIPVVDWKYVPAGNEDIPLYTAAATNSDLTFTQEMAGIKTTMGKVLVGSGLTGAGSGTSLTINHAQKTVTTTTPTADVASNAYKLTAVSSIGYDAYGHVQSVATTTYTIPDHSVIAFTTSTSAASNKATITSSVKQASSSTAVSSAWTIESENLQVTAAGSAGVKINLTWGTF